MDVIDAIERYLGSDPGGERSRSAANGAVAFLTALGVAAVLEALTHAFEVDGSLPGAAVTNHVARLAVLMLGSTTALVLSFVVADVTVRARAVTAAIAAVCLWAGFALAVVVHGSRPAAYILLVAVPAVGAWFRRYGARGFAAGFLCTLAIWSVSCSGRRSVQAGRVGPLRSSRWRRRWPSLSAWRSCPTRSVRPRECNAPIARVPGAFLL